MKLIKVTTLNDKKSIYLNIDMIGHIYETPEVIEYGKVKPKFTVIGHLSHNNGGFKVIESVDKILKLIKGVIVYED